MPRLVRGQALPSEIARGRVSRDMGCACAPSPGSRICNVWIGPQGRRLPILRRRRGRHPRGTPLSWRPIGARYSMTSQCRWA